MKLVMKNSLFSILQFTDIHLGPKPFVEEDLQTLETIRSICNKESADLIVITGDVIWTEGVADPLPSLEALFDLLNDFECPVALTYGNHDAEHGIRRGSLRDLEKKLMMPVDKKNTLVVNDRESYNLEIFQGEKLHTLLYFLDSGDIDPYGFGLYAWNQPEQIHWLKTISEQYKKEKLRTYKTDLLFQHIPVPEYRLQTSTLLSGQQLEEPETPIINTGLAANLLLDSNIYGMFCGHDHDNDSISDYFGLKLHYGRCTGTQCYGQLKRGARLIQISDTIVSTRIVEG